jgi:hypothetical protein
MITKFSINTKTGSFSANQCNVLTKLKPTTFSDNFTKIITKQPLNVSYLIVGGGAGGDVGFISLAQGANGGSVLSGNYDISTDIDIIVGSGGSGFIFYPNDPNIPQTNGNPSYIKYYNSSTILLSADGGNINPNSGHGGYGANINPPTGTNNVNGGNGVTSTITGSSVYYAGGGSGFYYTFDPFIEYYGTPGLGTYGKGGNVINSSEGESGNNGVVIISYKYPAQLARGGTITSYLSGGDTWWVHTFTSSGKLIL